jgi:hypothetical protein
LGLGQSHLRQGRQNFWICRKTPAALNVNTFLPFFIVNRSFSRGLCFGGLVSGGLVSGVGRRQKVDEGFTPGVLQVCNQFPSHFDQPLLILGGYREIGQLEGIILDIVEFFDPIRKDVPDVLVLPIDDHEVAGVIIVARFRPLTHPFPPKPITSDGMGDRIATR